MHGRKMTLNPFLWSCAVPTVSCTRFTPRSECRTPSHRLFCPGVHPFGSRGVIHSGGCRRLRAERGISSSETTEWVRELDRLGEGLSMEALLEVRVGLWSLTLSVLCTKPRRSVLVPAPAGVGHHAPERATGRRGARRSLACRRLGLP